jgi:3-methylcrotonyl-CoA carboxylase alpha subunit
MGESAIKSAQAIGYQGAGTVEFLLDVDGSFYFMEMNTRLQVEHPVTEMISGQDLVEWQLRVAAGEILPKTQQQLVLNGHAFEARIYAEDANNDFLPATGKLSLLQTPVESKHVRIDTGVRQGDEVSVYYDPMIAKLIVWDENRDKALKRLSKALSEYRINGVTTNIDFLYNLATSKPFIEEDIDTGFIEKNNDLIFHDNAQELLNELPIAALYLVLSIEKKSQQSALQSNDPYSPWHNANAWRLNEPHTHVLILAHNDVEYTVEIEQKRLGNDAYYLVNINDELFDCQGALNKDTMVININGHRSQATINCNENNISLYRANGVFNFTHILPDCGQHENDDSHGGLTAPMNGTMVSVLVKAGENVSKDQPLVIMEAMKMEHTIKAPSNGTINEVFFQAGDMVDGGAELLTFSANEES